MNSAVLIQGEDEKGDFAPTPLLHRLRRPTLPGIILRDLFLPRIGLSLTGFAAHIRVSRRTVSQLVNGSRPVSVDMAMRLSRALGTSPQFWMNLQRDVDIWDTQREGADGYASIEPVVKRVEK